MRPVPASLLPIYISAMASVYAILCGKKVRNIVNPVLKPAARHNRGTARRAPADAASSLETILFFLAKGEKVMLAKNLWQEVRLGNGIRGEVVEVVHTEGEPAPAPPSSVVVRFDEYTGPDWSSFPRAIDVVVVQRNGEGNTMTRTQLPLKRCVGHTQEVLLLLRSRRPLPLHVLED